MSAPVASMAASRQGGAAAEVAGRIQLGQHVCIVYDEPAELLEIATGYLSAGVAQGDQCLYIAHTTPQQELRDALARSGLGCPRHEAAGDLQIVGKEAVYLRGGAFEPDAVTAFIHDATLNRPERYGGVRGMGEMAWAGEVEDGFRKLIEYESKVNVLFRTLPFAGMCAYQRSRFPAAVLTEILRVHPVVYYKGRIYQNFFFVPPEEYLAQRKPELELERLLENLEARRGLEEQQVLAEVRRKHQEELERVVEERTAELVAINRDLETFNLSMSHDVRSHLRSIAAFCGMLAQKEADRVSPQGHDVLQRVVQSCRDLGQVVDRLVRLAQVSSLEVCVVPVDASAVATAQLQRRSATDPSRDVAWTVEPGIRVPFDPDLLEVVLDNLVMNAWKFTRRRAQARIAVRAVPGGFAIEDNGEGFAPELAAGLFQPFRRLHSGEEFEGYGIGLATVRRIVERHGGTVQAEGQPGRGARFTVTVPPQVAVRQPRKAAFGLHVPVDWSSPALVQAMP